MSLDVTDASDYRFGERFHLHLDQFGGSDPRERAEASDYAWKTAMEEMMDEQHAMLYAICEKLGIAVKRREDS